jgi:uncharacterized protein YpbB
LDKLFAKEPFDINFISERIHAAFDYFFVPMDSLVDELLWKLEEVVRIKKVKGFYEELSALEELQTRAVLRLMKAKLLIKTIASGETISKENLNSEQAKNYKANKMAEVREKFKSANVTLIENHYDLERYTSKKSMQAKEPKVSTVQETYELWQQKKTAKEIAEIRKLTQQTISGHLAKLIEADTISISDVLSRVKILALTSAFEGYNEDSLNNLKERHGNTFTWDELKMFKASLNAKS